MRRWSQSRTEGRQLQRTRSVRPGVSLDVTRRGLCRVGHTKLAQLKPGRASNTVCPSEHLSIHCIETKVMNHPRRPSGRLPGRSWSRLLSTLEAHARLLLIGKQYPAVRFQLIGQKADPAERMPTTFCILTDSY